MTDYTKVYGPIIPNRLRARVGFSFFQKRIIPKNIHPLYTPRYTQKFVGFFGIIAYYSNLAFARARTQV